MSEKRIQLAHQIDLSELQFRAVNGQSAAETQSLTFLAIPFGKWKHPDYGPLEFNAEKGRQFKDNFDNRVVGPELAIDYSHRAHEKAAGWVKSVELSDAGVHYTVEWTPQAKEAIRTKEWRYFSAELFEEWEHPKTGEVFSNVLMGGALTNRPFLKNAPGEGQLEVALAEYLGPNKTMTRGAQAPQGVKMDPVAEFRAAWARLFGEPKEDDAEEAGADEEGQEGASKKPAPKIQQRADAEEDDDEEEVEDDDEVEVTTAKVKASARNKGVTLADVERMLASRDRALAALEGKNIALQAALTAQVDQQTANAAKARTSRAAAAVQLAVDNGKIAPAVLEDASAKKSILAFAESDPDGFDTFVDNQPPIAGFVPRGFGDRGDAGGKKGHTFMDKVLDEQKASGVDLKTAATRIAQREPALYDSYRHGQNGNGRGN